MTLPEPHANRIGRAIDLVVRYGGIHGDHHRAWVIDQIVRSRAMLTTRLYDKPKLAQTGRIPTIGTVGSRRDSE